MKSTARLSVLLTLLILGGCAKRAMVIEGADAVVLDGATLVPGDRETIIPDSIVVLRGDRIAEIGREGDFEYGPEVEVLKLEGKWLVPGFFDTHIHLTEQEMMDRVLRLLLASGVTTVRVAAGLEEANVALREEIADGERLGPRIYTSGMPIDEADGPAAWMPKVDSQESMLAEVRRQANSGVDYIDRCFLGPSFKFVPDKFESGHGRNVIPCCGGSLCSERKHSAQPVRAGSRSQERSTVSNRPARTGEGRS